MTGERLRLTPQRQLRVYIMLALRELVGRAQKHEVLATIEASFGDTFTPDDWRKQPSNHEIKWDNQTAWERNAMVTDGLLRKYVVGQTTRRLGVDTSRQIGSRTHRHASPALPQGLTGSASIHKE